MSFTSDENYIVITTKGDSWWLSHITFGDEEYSLNEKDIDTSQDQFIIEGEYYRIERLNSNEIRIDMSENNSKTAQKLVVGLQAGNYFDGVIINQDGKE